MRAVAVSEAGAAPTVVDIEIPEPAWGEVRVQVRAGSVNGFDLSVASGRLVGMMEHRFPVVLGKDFAGTVDALGDGVDGFEVGDRVFGVVTKPYLGDGSLGEYVTVPVAIGIAHLPDSIDFAEGAALGLAGVAAVMAVDAVDLQAGQTVLVTGATGGVGNRAVQLAAATGATVVATAHTDDEQTLVRELGAAHTIDHTADVDAQVRALAPNGVDAVLNFAGEPTALAPLVRAGGRLSSTLLMSADQLPAENVAVTAIYANPDRATLERLAQHHVDGVRVVVQATYPLEQADAAFAAFGAGTLGKIVITVE
jgi:NADPH:quinone reductase-like Zn-dependent oxidoreductase